MWVKEDRIIGAIETAEDSRPEGVDPAKDPAENLPDTRTQPASRSDPSDPSALGTSHLSPDGGGVSQAAPPLGSGLLRLGSGWLRQ